MAVNIGPRIGIDGEAQYRSQLQNLIQTTKTYDAEMKHLQSTFSSETSAMERTTQIGRKLSAQHEVQKKKVEQLRKAVKESEKAKGEDSTTTMRWRQALAEAETELNRLEKEMKDLPTKTRLLGEAMQESGEKIKNAGEKISSVGSTLTKTVTAPILAVGTASIKMAADFETAMAKVSTIADGSVPIDEMADSIMKLSDQTGVAATDIAENVYSAISAGQDTADAVAFVAQTTKLAKAGFTETASAMDVLTTTLNAYHMSAEDAAKVSDNLITTQNLGKTTVAELASTMGDAIPTAAMYSVNLDNLDSAYVTLTKNGIQTNKATTAIVAVMSEMGKSGTTVSKILEDKTGKSFKELMEDGYSLTDALQIIQEEADATGVGIGDMFSNKNAIKGAASLIQNAEDFNNALEQMQSSAGATNTAFNKVSKTSAAQFQKTLNRVKNSGIELGQQLLVTFGPTIEKAMDGVKKATEAFNSLDDSQKELIIKCAALAAAIGPVAVVIGKTTEGVGTLVSGFGKMFELAGTSGTLLNTLVSNIGLVGGAVGGVTALVGLGILAYEGWQDTAKGAAAEAENALGNVRSLHDANQTAIGDAETLAARVQELASKENLSAEEKLELRSAVDKLNSVMPDLNLAIDENTGNLDANSKAILNNIDAALMQYKVEKNKEELAEITEAYAEAEEALAKATKERIKAENSTAADYGGDLQARTEAIQNAVEAEKSAIASKDELTERYNTLTTVNEELTGKIQEETTALEESQPVIDETTTELDELATSEDEVGTSATEAAEEAQKAWQQAYESMYQSISSQVKLFDELNIASDLNAQQMAANLDTQTKAYTDYSNNLSYMSQLAEQDTTGSMSAILASIASMGIDGAGYLQALVEAAQKNDGSLETVLASFGEAESAKQNLVTQLTEMSQGGVEAVEGLASGVEEQIAPTEEASSEVVEGVSSEISKGTPKVQSATTKVSTAAGQITSKLNTVASNSKSAAARIPSGIASAITAGVPNVTGAIQGLQNAANTGMNGGTLYSTYYTYGTHLGQGFAEGIRSQASNVQGAAKALADAAASNLHHSTPDEGPLKGDDKWGAEMAAQFAEGMLSQKRFIARASEVLARAAVFLPRNEFSSGGINGAPMGQKIDSAAIYNAVKAGMAEAGQKPVVINEKSFKRALVGMGVSMA